MKIVKVPSGLSGLGKSSGKAPDLVCAKLGRYELNENLFSLKFEVDEVLTSGNIDEIGLDIYNKALGLSKGVFIGGDHSLTYHAFKGFASKYSNPGLVIFDAHPDCEVCTSSASHEDFVRKLIDDGILKKENLVLVGVRCFSKNEISFLKKNRIKYFTMKQIYGNFEDVCDSVMEILREFDGFYLSLDVDVLDPAFAPGVGYREPGGFSVRELIYFLGRLRLLKGYGVCDLVEINPEKDVGGLTVDVGAKLIWEMCKDF